MEDLETMPLVHLRKNLVDAIISAHGKNFALGWLESSFCNGNYFHDDRHYLITLICDYRACKESTISL